MTIVVLGLTLVVIAIAFAIETSEGDALAKKVFKFLGLLVSGIFPLIGLCLLAFFFLGGRRPSRYVKRCGASSIAGFVLLTGNLLWETTRDARRKAAGDGERWGEALTVCSGGLGEALGPLGAGAKVVFVTRAQGSEGWDVRSVGVPAELGATSKLDATHVACVAFTESTVATCSYTGGRQLVRVRRDASIRLVELKSKAVVARWEAAGPEPPECPQTIRSAEVPRLTGAEPGFVNGLLRLWRPLAR